MGADALEHSKRLRIRLAPHFGCLAQPQDDRTHPPPNP
jgi:hypothetical protein